MFIMGFKMINILIFLAVILFGSARAGFPPTTLNGQAQPKAVSFNSLVPNSQATLTSSGTLIETGNGNLLVDPGFEGSTVSSAWVGSGNTLTYTNTSGNFAEGLQALSAQTGFPVHGSLYVSQDVATPFGSTTQYVVGAKYKVPATMPDFQVCTRINGVEKTCVPSANLIIDGNYHSIEIPEIATPGQSIGIAFKTTALYVGLIAYFDSAYIKQGLGTQALQLDNVYSAQVITTTGVISNQNKTFISSCTAANPAVCTFIAGVFTVAPTCSVSLGNATTGTVGVQLSNNTSATTISFNSFTTRTGAALANQPITVICQKSGNDYLSSSSAVYTASATSNIDTSYSAQVTTTSGAIANQSKTFLASCTAANSTVCTFTSGIFTITPNCTATAVTGASGAFVRIDSINSTSISVSSYTSNTAGALASVPFLIICQKAGVDYTSAFHPTITGSFAGIPAVPGYQGNVDHFSLSYFANSSMNSICNTSPCYIDQIGSAVLSTGLTRSALGVYAMATIKTYKQLKCTNFVTNGSFYTVQQYNTGIPGMSCNNCNSINWTTANTSLTLVDTSGVITCDGAY